MNSNHLSMFKTFYLSRLIERIWLILFFGEVDCWWIEKIISNVFPYYGIECYWKIIWRKKHILSSCKTPSFQLFNLFLVTSETGYRLTTSICEGIKILVNKQIIQKKAFILIQIYQYEKNDPKKSPSLYSFSVAVNDITLWRIWGFYDGTMNVVVVEHIRCSIHEYIFFGF